MSFINTSLTYGSTPFVVNQNAGQGSFSTVQAALDSAGSAANSSNIQTVIINGIFNENITIPDYVNLVGISGDPNNNSAVINGNATRTSATSESTSVSGIQFSSGNATAALAVSGSASIRLENCNLFNSSTGNVLETSSSGALTLRNCTLSTSGAGTTFQHAGAGDANFAFCNISNTSTGTTVTQSSTGGSNFQSCNVSNSGTGRTLDVSSGGMFMFYSQVGGNGTVLSTIDGTQFINLFCNNSESFDVSGTTFAVIFMSVANASGTNPLAILHSGTTLILALSPITSTAASGYCVEAGGSGDAGSLLYGNDAFSPFGTANAYDPLLTISPIAGSFGEVQATALTMATTRFTSATAGTASALPATPEGYMAILMNGGTVRIPYYLE